jgi:hypothetical protein
MALLINISACGEYADSSHRQLQIETSFEFDIILNESEAKSVGMNANKAYECHLVVRLLTTGECDEIVLAYQSVNSDETMTVPVAEKYVDNAFDIIESLKCIESATCSVREKLDEIVAKISADQPNQPIEIIYGTDYDAYLQVYNGYRLQIFEYGISMIEKYVNLRDDSDTGWQISGMKDAHISDTELYSSVLINEAKQLAEDYNMRDACVLLSDDAIQQHLDAVSIAGRERGKSEVRNMSDEKDIPLFMPVTGLPNKDAPNNAALKTYEKLCKNAGLPTAEQLQNRREQLETMMT